MRMIMGAVALLFGLLAVGCNGEVVGGGHRPAAVLVVSGDLQTGTVGQELPQPLVVKVVDEAGRPVRDQLVNFRVAAGGGSVFAGSAITNRNGIAQERWTLGTVAGDTQQVEARAVDPETGAAVVFATFRAIGQSAGGAAIQAIAPASATGTAGQVLADSLAVRVHDAYGNAVPGATVTWTVTAGGGSVSPATSVSRADGVAKVAWTLGGAAGAQTVRASLGGQAQVEFTAQAGSAGAVTVEIVAPPLNFTSLNQQFPIHVQGRDAFGNLVGGAPVMLISLDASIVSLGEGPTTYATSLRNGSTRIIATLQANGAADTVEATVQQVPVNLRVTPDLTHLLVGESVALSAQSQDARGVYLPSVAVSYASESPGVVTVQGNVATAQSAGTAQVRGTASSGVQDGVVVEVYNPFSARSVSTGYRANCAIGLNGATYCWGGNGQGQLVPGGSYAGVPIPTRLAADPGFAQLFITDMTSSAMCGLTDAGAAYCWGGPEGFSATTPSAVPGGLTFTTLGVGSSSACGVTPGQEVYCWGNGSRGILGNGDTTASALPVKVASSVPFVDVAVGSGHACAVAASGTMYCWGSNYNGELGYAHSPNCSDTISPCVLTTPRAVAGGHDFVQVVAGNLSTCALTSAGAAYCWGSNTAGQLGIPRSTEGTVSPTPVSGGHVFTSLSGGNYHTCALKAGGEAYCWGLNRAGQAGQAGVDYALPGRAIPSLTFTSIDPGYNHTCGVAAGGGVYCWGSANNGELGDALLGSSSALVRVKFR